MGEAAILPERRAPTDGDSPPWGRKGPGATRRRVLGSLLAAAVALWTAAVPAQTPAQPEGPSGTTPKRAVVATKHMAVAANPHAADAGIEILRLGGSAIDAAIAMQMVLTLVEPQSSGIGGGGFLLHYDASTKTIVTYDGREVAPAAATPDIFLGPDGKPLPFAEAAVGGQAVGVPGIVRMLEMAHRDYGRLPWSRLFEPAMRLAEGGFLVSPRLHQLIVDNPQLKEMPRAREHFYDEAGEPRAAGTRIYNPSLFETLRLIANGGSDAFYRGAIARDIVATVTDPAQQGPADKAGRRIGRLTLADLALYRAVKRDAVCGIYRGLRVCGMGPPSSGGIAVAQTLGILDHHTLRDLSPGSVEAIHLISEATRLAFADRNRYVADADMVEVPTRALISPSYLEARAGLISPVRSMGRAVPGSPSRQTLKRVAPDTTVEAPGTSHLAVVDGAGNAVSFTTSIEQAFGSRLFVRGFLLNNQMTDFAFQPAVNGAPAINRVEPGKRPRSSMSPTMVTDRQGRLLIAVGSPGGPRIIPYVVQSLVGMIDWSLDIQRAFNLPHHVNMNGPTELEDGTRLEAIAPDLQRLGHEVRVAPLTSGLHGIMVIRQGDKVQLIGGADPRREGQVYGD